jgi:hypothetical protein
MDDYDHAHIQTESEIYYCYEEFSDRSPSLDFKQSKVWAVIVTRKEGVGTFMRLLPMAEPNNLPGLEVDC